MSDRSEWPSWVRLSLFGVPSRRAALGYMWFCLAVAGGSLLYALRNPIFLAGGVMILAAYPYWAAIKWVDANDHW